MTKKITEQDQKQIMLEMLRYIDGVCRKNNINYSLFGGTLIGAIRHKGYIPWDDDLDIILTKENYDKLREILKKNSGKYKILRYGRGGEQFGFTKLVDMRTRLAERGKTFDDYGVYIDIFCYYPVPQDYKKRYRHYKKAIVLMSLLSGAKTDFKHYSLKWNFWLILRNTISRLDRAHLANRMFYKLMNKYVNDRTDYVMHNCPGYGFDKEIQLKKNTEEYIDVKFEGVRSMAFKKYDEILRTTFGDYMQLPPESERIPKHNAEMWWRDGCESVAGNRKKEKKCEEIDDNVVHCTREDRA